MLNERVYNPKNLKFCMKICVDSNFRKSVHPTKINGYQCGSLLSHSKIINRRK